LVRLLYQHAWRMSLIVGVLGSTGTAYIMRDSLPLPWLAAWLVLINATILGRIALILRFRELAPTDEQCPRWGRNYQTLVWCNGLAWGLPGLLLSTSDSSVWFFYATMVAGFVAGAIPQLSYRIQAFYGFAILSISPLGIRLLLAEQAPLRIIGVMAVLFMAINIAAARISYRRVCSQIRLEQENRQLVEHLKEEKERAENANREKSRFLAAASHDLRQPMHAIGLFIHALATHELDDETRKLVDNIRLSSASLEELFDSLLDISRLDAGTLKADLQVFSLGKLLRQIAEEFTPEATAKGVSLCLFDCNARVYSDETMLGRILRNAVSNAVRYTETGGVLIGWRRRGRNIRIEVYDTGTGIPEKELARVYDEFYRLSGNQRQQQQGLGLGLSIIKRLAEILHHPCQLSSELGRGTVFSVSVPEAHSNEVATGSGSASQGDLTGTRMLIIEDDPAIIASMRELVSIWGCTVMTATSMETALDQIEAEDILPDIIVSDYHLQSGQDGIEVVNAIRTRVGEAIPALILTGDTSRASFEKARENGLPLLHKPLAPARLRSVVSFLLGSTPSGSTGHSNRPI